MPHRTVRGAELYYDLYGHEGDPAVLVHGSWSDRHAWDLVAPALSQALEVVVYDRRGHGESSATPRAQPVRDDAADLAGLLESLNIYPAHIIAHSYGSAVALRLAVDRPEMVRSLSLHEPPFLGLLGDDPATEGEGAELGARLRELQALVRSERTEAAAERFLDLVSTEPGAWRSLARPERDRMVRAAPLWALEFDDPEALRPAAAVRELLIPVLLTEGSQSPRFVHRVTRATEAMLRNCQVLEIPEAAHFPHLVRPYQYVGLLLTFLLERNVPGS